MAIGLQEVSPLLKPLTFLGLDRRLVAELEELGKLASAIWMFHDQLNSLSKEGAEGIIQSLILEFLTAGLAEIGVPLDKVLNIPGELRQFLVEELASWSGITLQAMSKKGIQIKDTVLYQAVSQFIDWFSEGKAIANSPKRVRHPQRTADPLLIYRGEFEREAVDLEIPGAGAVLSFRRFYRSSAGYLGPLGPGWDHSYNLRLREENEFTCVRSTGRLSEERYARHPRFPAADFAYYAPPDGVHSVLVPDGAGSFILRQPRGATYAYESGAQPREHRIHRIQDRFGNYLAFHYSADDLLDRVYANSQYRFLDLTYDSTGLLERVEDHTGRTVTYSYDDFGQLDRAAGPALRGEAPRRLESYEYDQVGRAFKLGRVYDWAGRPVVENEYQSDPVADYFGFLTRQRVNRGEATFTYAPVDDVYDPTTPATDIPVLHVWESRRNGHEIFHLLNRSGNELLRRERVIEGANIRQAVSRFRLNADGEIVASFDPEGVLTQHLFGREQIADTIDWPDIDRVLGDVPMLDRMAFGNLLASATRFRAFGHASADDSPEFWTQVPPIKLYDHTSDAFTKHTYARDSQLETSRSDPSYTASADPLHTESSPPGYPNYNPASPLYIEHQRHLILFFYGAAPRYELARVVYPARTRPSALMGLPPAGPTIEEFASYDAGGRLLRRIDPRGYEWFFEYYPASLDPALRAKEGFLHRRLVPHWDLLLDQDTPGILEIERVGQWQAEARRLESGGAVGEAIRLRVDGSRLALYQSHNPPEIISANPSVEVAVDGQAPAIWNQAADPVFVVENLSPGRHTVQIRDPVGVPFSIGMVRTHVSLDTEVDDLGRALVEIDGRGFHSVHLVDAEGRVLQTRQGPAAFPTEVRYEYDPAGRTVVERTEWRDEAGVLLPQAAEIRRREYDSGSLLVAAIEGSEQGGDSRVVRHQYDVEDNLKTSIAPRGRRTDWEYDEMNRQIKTWWAACAPESSLWATYYDLSGRVWMRRDSRGALRVNGYRDKAGNWQNGIDTRGRVWVETDPLGNLTRTSYDAHDRPVAVRRFQLSAGGQFHLLSRHETVYDEQGSIVKQSEAVFQYPLLTPDPIAVPDAAYLAALQLGTIQTAVTEFHVDAGGALLATRAADDTIQRQRSDGQGRVVDQADPGGSRIFRLFDGNGNVERTYSYDPVPGPAGLEVFVESREFDEWNREIARIDAYGNSWRRAYDTLGNLALRIDPLGTTIRFRYNVFRQEVRREDLRPPSLPLVVVREYDSAGNLTAVVDPAEHRTEYSYDLLDRLIESRFAIGPNQPVETRGYDSGGDLTLLVDRNGVTQRLDYDLEGRHVRTRIHDPVHVLSGWAATFQAFQYDAAGRLTQHENDYFTAELRYDSRGLGWLERVTPRNIAGAPAPLEIRREFDLMQRRARLVYPSGRELSYEYTVTGQLAAIRNVVSPADYPGRGAFQSAAELARFRYNGRRLAETVLGNGLTLTLRHDGCGQPLDRRVTDAAGAEIWRMQRLRDGAGHTRVETFTTRAGGRSRTFWLDPLDRLTHYQDSGPQWLDPAQIAPPASPVDPAASTGQAALDAAIGAAAPPGPAVYELDDLTNRLRTREPGQAVVDSVPNALNQYSQVDAGAWNHDAAGNLRADGSHRFSYDAANQLVEIANIAGRSQAVYLRDALNRVIAEILPAETRFLIHDGVIPLVEIAGGNRTEYTPHHLSGDVLHAAQGGEDYWITRDGLGSPRLVSEAQGIAVSVPVYRPYGAAEDGEAALSPLRFSFGGMIFTRGLPFLHAQARIYRPDLGRFLQRDPAGYADGLNLYLYAGGNPVDRWDPTGLQGEYEEGEFRLQVPQLLLPERPPLTLFPPDAAPPPPTAGPYAGLAHMGAGTVIGFLSLGLVTEGVGWLVGLAAGLGLSGGIFEFGAGAAELATAPSRTPEQEAVVSEGISLTSSLASLGGMVGGLGGLVLSGDENGLRLGAAIGGLGEGTFFLGSGIRRAYQLEQRFTYSGSAYNWDTNFKRRIREAYNLTFTRTAETRPNTLFTQGFETLELSHFVPQELFKDWRFARSIFNRPWNVKPLWSSEHALVDLSRQPGAAFWAVYGSPYPFGIRLLYNTPRWLQETAYGATTFGKAIEYYQPAPEVQRPGLFWRRP